MYYKRSHSCGSPQSLTEMLLSHFLLVWQVRWYSTPKVVYDILITIRSWTNREWNPSSLEWSTLHGLYKIIFNAAKLVPLLWMNTLDVKQSLGKFAIQINGWDDRGKHCWSCCGSNKQTWLSWFNSFDRDIGRSMYRSKSWWCGN